MIRKRSAEGKPGGVQKFAKGWDGAERITRKKNRWVDRLSLMPVAERYALLSAFEELGGTTPP